MNYTQTYIDSNILTASPEKLVILMYEGAIKFLKKAKDDINKKDFEEACECLYKSQLIIGELMSSLDMKYGTISQNLLAIYSHCYDKIVGANIKKDIKIIDEVRSLLTELLESWNIAYKKVSTEQNNSYKKLEIVS